MGGAHRGVGTAVPRKKKIDELVVVKLLNRAKARLDDPVELNRTLREVAKFFDPLTGKAMIEGSARQQIVMLAERGNKAEAVAAIEHYLDTYQKRIEPSSSQTLSAEQCGDSKIDCDRESIRADSSTCPSTVSR
jgi:hypothetical protein